MVPIQSLLAPELLQHRMTLPLLLQRHHLLQELPSLRLQSLLAPELLQIRTTLSLPPLRHHLLQELPSRLFPSQEQDPRLHPLEYSQFLRYSLLQQIPLHQEDLYRYPGSLLSFLLPQRTPHPLRPVRLQTLFLQKIHHREWRRNPTVRLLESFLPLYIHHRLQLLHSIRCRCQRLQYHQGVPLPLCRRRYHRQESFPYVLRSSLPLRSF